MFRVFHNLPHNHHKRAVRETHACTQNGKTRTHYHARTHYTIVSIHSTLKGFPFTFTFFLSHCCTVYAVRLLSRLLFLRPAFSVDLYVSVYMPLSLCHSLSHNLYSFLCTCVPETCVRNLPSNSVSRLCTFLFVFLSLNMNAFICVCMYALPPVHDMHMLYTHATFTS